MIDTLVAAAVLVDATGLGGFMVHSRFLVACSVIASGVMACRSHDDPSSPRFFVDGGDRSDDADGGRADSGPRAELGDDLDVMRVRAEIRRVDGHLDHVIEDELFLAPTNRAWIYLTAWNKGDGWAPINFELCVDHAEALGVYLGSHAELREGGVVLDAPCAVRYGAGNWPILHPREQREFLVGSVIARTRPAGGYLTIYFRSSFPGEGEIDLYEYTVPYRVLPSRVDAGR